MPAIPHIIFGGANDYQVERGDLINIPAEFFSKSQMDFYRRASAGWSVCPLGYNVYSGEDSLGRKLVFPGIVFPELDQKRRKKFPNYALRFAKNNIEAYIRPHFERAIDLRAERDTLYRNLTHDLRAISTEIYNQSLTARDAAAKRGDAQITKGLDRVLGAQQMMSVRLDIIDYESGIYSTRSFSNIKVFPKVEKVYLCFSHKFKKKGINSYLTGNSFSEVFGPDILEIVFFVLIENAIKYSPKGGSVTVGIRESQQNVRIEVTSLGPCIAIHERAKVFERGYRGVAAERLTKSGGAGIGLFAARSIVDSQFGGKIEVSQESQRTWIDGANYYITSFTVVLPIARKVEKKTFRRRKLFRSGNIIG